MVESLIEEFDSPERFDLVLCEGTIPFQVDPGAFARRAGRFAAPGGLLVVTCIDGASFLGEATRRLIADAIVPFATPVPERLAALAPLFVPHLATLAGMSRPVEDWIYDNLLVPYRGRLFSIGDAIAALGADFDVLGSSPDFLVDWRWYKEIHSGAQRYNERAVEQYLAAVPNLVDCRVTIPPQPPRLGEAILERAAGIFDLMVAMETSGDLSRLSEAARLTREVAAAFAGLSERTSAALHEAALFLESGSGSPGPFGEFASFFGRGQQYLSFIRRS